MAVAHERSIHPIRKALIGLAVAFVALHASIVCAQEGPMPLPDEWQSVLDWRSIGPANMGGRITDIAVDPNDHRQWWVATASGGLLHTDNNGTTFEHQFDHETTVSLGAVAVAPCDANIVWVGTGEENPRNSSSYGNGVYKSTDGGETWTHMGLDETFQTGSIIVHPEDPNTVYVGSLGRLWGANEQRGLFKTTDGGENWEKVLYVDDKTGVIDIDMHPGDPDTLIVATYERMRDNTDNNDPIKKWGPGSGLYRTTDGGENFEKLTEGLPTVDIGRIGVDWYQSDPDYVYAVIETEWIGGQSAKAGEMGVRTESADVGARLTDVGDDSPAQGAGLAEGDIIIQIDDEMIIDEDDFFRETRRRQIGETLHIRAVREGEVVELDVTLEKREDVEDPETEEPSRRRSPFSAFLGGQQENLQDHQGEDGFQYGGVYRSSDGGTTWERINSANPRPMYYSQIRVDPSDNNHIFLLGTSLYRSEDGGATFMDDQHEGENGSTHVDHHAMWIDPDDGRHVILGNDGGIYVTYDRSTTWDHLNHMAIGQFYHVGVGPRLDYNVYGGLQDNGSWGGPSRSGSERGPVNTDWFRIGGGDGFICLVDPNDPDLIYSESQNGGMGRINLRTGDRGFIRPRPPRGTRYNFNWKTPFILSHHNSKIYYGAGNYVFKSVDRGDNMVAISPEITHTDEGAASAIGESPYDADVLYVGTTDGYVWVTRDGGDEWTNVWGEEEVETEEADPDQPAGERSAEARRRARARMRMMIERLDANEDGQLQREEVPERLHEMFDRLDDNDDGVISRTEMQDVGGEAAALSPEALARVLGTFNITLKGEGVPEESAEIVMTLEQNDEGAIVGTAKSQALDGRITEAAFDAEESRLTAEIESNLGRMSLEGTISERTISGTITGGGGLLTIPFEGEKQDDQAAPEEEPEGDVEEAEETEAVDEPEAEAQAPDPVTGTWDAQAIGDIIPEGEGDFTLTLKLLEDNRVEAEIESTQLTGESTSGAFDRSARKVTFVFETEQGDVTFTGTIEDNAMEGTIVVGEGAVTLEFEAEKRGGSTARTLSFYDAVWIEYMHAAYSDDLTIERPTAVTAERNGSELHDREGQRIATSPGAADASAHESTPATQDDDPISGEWTGELKGDQIPPEMSEISFTLKLDEENKVTGSFTSAFVDDQISSGTFNRENNRLSVDVEGRQGTITLAGTVSDNTWTGTLSAGGGAFEVDFEVKRTQPAEQQQQQEEDAQAEETEEAGDDASDDGSPRALKEILPKPMWVSSIEPSRHDRSRVYITIDGHRTDNDDPWVLVSEDYGETWRLISANLPRGSTRCVREDRDNENVLYVGTEFGAYVSIDRGESWRTLGNLPTVAVHEVAQHPVRDEIVAGTHGRSLWILDVSALRQITPQVMEEPVHLFQPATAIRWRNEPSQGDSGLRRFVGENPPDGAPIYYLLRDDADEVELEIRDVSGRGVQEIDASTEGGVHQVTWNLRREIRTRRGRFSRGPMVDPGQYLVVLTVDDEEYTQVVTVMNDPEAPEDATPERFEAFEVLGGEEEEGEEDASPLREEDSIIDDDGG